MDISKNVLAIVLFSLVLIMVLMGYGRDNAVVYTDSKFSESEVMVMNFMGIGIEDKSYISGGENGTYNVRISDAQELILKFNDNVNYISHPNTFTTGTSTSTGEVTGELNKHEKPFNSSK